MLTASESELEGHREKSMRCVRCRRGEDEKVAGFGSVTKVRTCLHIQSGLSLGYLLTHSSFELMLSVFRLLMGTCIFHDLCSHIFITTKLMTGNSFFLSYHF